MKLGRSKKIIIFSILFLSIAFLVTPVFAAKIGEACTSDAQCSEKNSICDKRVKLCTTGCTDNSDCTSPYTCNTTTKRCEGNIPTCPSNQIYSSQLKKCVIYQQSATATGTCCIEKTNDKYPQNLDCIDVIKNSDCSVNNTSSKTYVRQNSSCKDILGCSQTQTRTSSPDAPAPEKKPFVPIVPKLQINIPTITFSKIIKDSDRLKIPFLAEYIKGIYEYAVSIVSIIAVIMIMIGGLMWLTSGGSGERIRKAKDTIAGSIMGLILVFGSYVLLNSINTNLTNFETINITYIEQQGIDLEGFDKGDPGINGGSGKISNTTYDNIFQKYAPCAGVDWRVLKAVAYKESSLKADLVNKYGYTGLFQFKTNTCPKSSIGSKCDNLKDPDNNTAAGAIMLKRNLNKIKKYCPNLDTKTLFTLMYMAHNSGLGSVYCATHSTCKVATSINNSKPTYTKINSNGSCNLTGIKNGIVEFWNNHYKNKVVGKDRGIRTFNYSVSTANTIMNLAGGNINTPPTGSCPL